MSAWRRSSFCAGNGECIELSADPETGRVAFRLSDLVVDGKPERRRGWLVASGPEFATFLAGCRAGDFDDLAARP
jgi:hypothetical protein